MNTGICRLSLIPVRSEPTHKAEMVNQLLFGDVYSVLSEEKGWLKISTTHDNYMGWIDIAQHYQNTGQNQSGFSVALDTVCYAYSQMESIAVLAGSSLPGFDGINFKINKEKWVYNGQALAPDPVKNFPVLEKIALRYLNAPYLWGGRSPLGIDCSGFTQIVYKFIGISLLRDAYQQAEQGVLINFLEETQAGDLAFFHNQEGKITHVGIVLGDQKIIHSSGKVRIDKLDHFGIFNAELKKYSHQLKIFKRLV